ncbi:HPr kinase [Rhodospirillum rubrum]|uniref:Hpr(Ser) kinase/phosphatase n=1 Tax=Rhodospirillum rubrum (strain ATCC 11170 / ATH 1.1.1 / DSM 467 / LMG 4362 / NCIMB 8255 / S1) TaxID=269796 RepID=Q2RUD0_RHORT|nr:HPr kinase [Rhodospirillum rubrum]ABC22265.1 Hpr(Ser) kinase/phosphatase [Rhodospirillum rubrum ATCC 11170]AEO47983.1 Hpr(Ser) kinase/phosphatase [Rhodospirillum rubrum F11]MBK5953831.1 serine kinase [Rhodospirillum rubrum]QXG81907.1 serine kinase [Rhodospirillum rubrum]HCF17006.1 serine kinase [Rhodospirillum rubrum]
MTGDYALCGWRVRIDRPSTFAPPWIGEDRPVDITIRHAAFSPPSPPLLFESPLVGVFAEGAIVLRINPGLGFLIEGGARITVDATAQTGEAEIATFLFGQCLGFLALQRRQPALRAASVVRDGRAVVLAGAAGVGKSTLAAALMAKGWGLLADEVTLIDPRTLLIPPAFGRIKLWKDSATHLGLEAAALPAVRPGWNKGHAPYGGHLAPAPVPLAAIILIEQAYTAKTAGIDKIAPREALAALNDQLHGGTFAGALAARPACFDLLTTLVGGVPVFQLSRPWHGMTLAPLVELLTAEMAR